MGNTTSAVLDNIVQGSNCQEPKLRMVRNRYYEVLTASQSIEMKLIGYGSDS